MATGRGMEPLAISAVRVTCSSSSLVVERLDVLGDVGRAIGVGVGRGPPHVGGHLAHLLDQAAGARRQLDAEPAHGAPRHVLGQVAAALELGKHAQHRHQVAQLLGTGRPLRQLSLGELLHLEVERVDHVVALGEHPGRLAVAGEQGVGGAGHAFAHQREELDDLAVDALEALGDIAQAVVGVQCDVLGHRPTVASGAPSGNGRRRPPSASDDGDIFGVALAPVPPRRGVSVRSTRRAQGVRRRRISRRRRCG